MYVIFWILTVIITAAQWIILFKAMTDDAADSKRVLTCLLIPWGFLVLLYDHVQAKEMEAKQFSDIEVCQAFCQENVKGFKGLDEAERLVIADRCRTWHNIFKQSGVISS